MIANSTLENEKQDTFLQDAKPYMAYKIVMYVENYWFPVLVPLGLVGNTLSFLVMIRQNNRKISTCIYMAAISINDNLLLFLGTHEWLIATVSIREWFLLECKISTYLSIFSLQCATYLVLAMTIDKYIAIKWPHRSATYSTPKRTRYIIVTVFCILLMYNLPHFFITNLIKGKCYGYSIKGIFTKVFSWLNIVLNAVIPFTLLIHMNYVIVQRVRNSHKSFVNNVGALGTEKRQKTMRSAENQLTTMLLLVTTLFVILLLPTYIRFIYASFVVSDTPSKFASSMLISAISCKLYVTNSGINFFLYCVSGQKFRKDLKEIVCYNRQFHSSTMDSSVSTIASKRTEC